MDSKKVATRVDKFDRIFQLHAILRTRRTAIPHEDLMARLECSPATLYRAITTLKNTLNAPVVFDKDSGGIRYDSGGELYELPGLWFTPAQLQALTVLQRLLEGLGAGVFEEHFEPVTKLINELLAHKRLKLNEAAKRFRIPGLAIRPSGPAFQSVVSATLQRRKFWFEYQARGSGEITDRIVSPQRVTHYREGWYLDAWDENRTALRIFAIEQIGKFRVLEDAAQDVPEEQLDEYYASAYGIFGGKADKIAVLRFSKERARWVSDEQWHPKQEARFLEDGRYELRIPYADSRELIMDVMRHGAHVEVVGPPGLRHEIVIALKNASALYTP